MFNYHPMKPDRYLTVALSGLLLLAACARAESPAPEPGLLYELAVGFDPADGRLSVEGIIEIVTPAETDTIELLLNGGLSVQRFDADRPAKVRIENAITFDSYELPHTQRITLALEEPLAAGAELTLTFAYEGQITTESIEIGRGVVSPGWSELTMEALWYPVWLQGPPIRSDVRLTLPEGYEVAGPGSVDPLADGAWRLRPNGPVHGRITFIASDGWTEARRTLGDGITGRVLTLAPEPRSDDLLDAAQAVFGAYRTLFGAPGTASDTLTIVYANRDIGITYPRQAYSTGGDFIVLDESPAQVQIDTLHHEIAHFWWSLGTPGTPDEFMSESISEFLAVRHGGDVWGEAWLTERRADMAARSAEVQESLREIDGLTATRQTLLYNRGPTALFELQDQIGRAALDAVLINAHAARTDTLQGFLAHLSALQGEDVAGGFADRL